VEAGESVGGHPQDSLDQRRLKGYPDPVPLRARPDLKWEPFVDDVNPKRFYDTLPTGPWAGKAADIKVVEDEIKEYYGLMGWDERGIPTSEELKRLGLDSVVNKLDEIR